jgi:hypothetical protein
MAASAGNSSPGFGTTSMPRSLRIATTLQPVCSRIADSAMVRPVQRRPFRSCVARLMIWTSGRGCRQ